MKLDGESGGGKRLSMPADYLPIPEGYLPPDPAEEREHMDLRILTQEQLMDLAQTYNAFEDVNVAKDPFEAVLHGIPERAQLRPDSKRPACNYMGLEGLGKYSKYGKAWARLYKGVGILDDEQPAPKRTKAAAAAASKPKPRKRRNDPKDFRNWTRQQLEADLTPEQQRWRSALTAFLGRPIDLPLLAPGAPVLDLQKLFIEVMAQGGQAQVTQAKGWSTFARHMQREPGYGPLVAAVYNCYLHPLELLLPYGFRAAKGQDLMSSKKLAREAMGPRMGARLATYDAVQYTADRAEARLRQLLGARQQQQQQLPGLPPLPPKKQQQQQQPAGGRKGGATATAPAAAGSKGRTSARQQQAAQQQQAQDEQQHQLPQEGAPQQQQQQEAQQQPRAAPDIAQLTLQMLHAAAREPEALAELLKQHKLSSGLHKPLRKACMQDYRKKLTARFKRKNLDEQVDLWEENGDDVLFGVEATDYSDSEGPGSESDGGAGGSNRAASQYMGAAGAAAALPVVLPAADAAAAAAAAAGAGAAAASSGGGSASSGATGGRGSSTNRGRGRGGRGRGQGRVRGRQLSSDNAADDSAAEDANDGPPQQQQLLPPLWQTDRVAHDAARCMLLSRRAVLSGPPGCKKAPLQLPGMLPRVSMLDRRGSGGGRGRGRGRGRGAGAGRGAGRGRGVEKVRKRLYLGRTPRCGRCKNCLNPSFKQACIPNRQTLMAKLKPRGGVQKGKGAASKAAASKAAAAAASKAAASKAAASKAAGSKGKPAKGKGKK